MAGWHRDESVFHDGHCCATQTTECGSKRSWDLSRRRCAAFAVAWVVGVGRSEDWGPTPGTPSSRQTLGPWDPGTPGPETLNGDGYLAGLGAKHWSTPYLDCSHQPFQAWDVVS